MPKTDEKKQRELLAHAGRLLAEYYIEISAMVRSTSKKRAALKRQTLSIWRRIPKKERAKRLKQQHALLAEGFRAAIVGPLRKKAAQRLGMKKSDFKHIRLVTPGNPDITPGLGAMGTDADTTLLGPTVNVKQYQTTVTFGAGPEVDHRPAVDSFMGGEDIPTAAGKGVKGAGVWIKIQIDC